MSLDDAYEPAVIGSRSADLAVGLVLAARQLSQAESVLVALSQLVWLARDIVPGAEYIGVSTGTGSGFETVASSDPLVNSLDELQYGLNEGPCLDAMTSGVQELVTDMEVETRWPRFAPQAFAAGVRSQMGTGLYRRSASIGGLNIYSSKADAFDGRARHAAMLLAMQFTVAMGHIVVVSELTQGLQSRQVIGQAVGIVMQKYTVDEQTAFAHLARLSQNSNIKLRDVASQMVREVAARPAAMPQGFWP